MRRRDAFGLLALGVLPEGMAQAQHQHQAMQKSGARYAPQFFSTEEHRKLDRLTEMILPADDHSPGASAARVADFVDLVMANSPADAQQRWRRGLAALTPDSLPEAAREELSPKSDAGRFFVALKQMTVFAYYSSETGLRKDLEYKGNQVLGSFPGCQA